MVWRLFVWVCCVCVWFFFSNDLLLNCKFDYYSISCSTLLFSKLQWKKKEKRTEKSQLSQITPTWLYDYSTKFKWEFSLFHSFLLLRFMTMCAFIYIIFFKRILCALELANAIGWLTIAPQLLFSLFIQHCIMSTTATWHVLGLHLSFVVLREHGIHTCNDHMLSESDPYVCTT